MTDDRMLDPRQESSPLQPTDANTAADFWEQYFSLQEMVFEAALQDTRFKIDITNHTTGESVSVENVKLLSWFDQAVH